MSGSAASLGIAASMGTSLIALAASRTILGSGSFRKSATPGSSSRRRASTTPMRTAGDGSRNACRSAPASLSPASPMTPAWRR